MFVCSIKEAFLVLYCLSGTVLDFAEVLMRKIFEELIVLRKSLTVPVPILLCTPAKYLVIVGQNYA
jgi:hypothetical protein